MFSRIGPSPSFLSAAVIIMFATVPLRAAVVPEAIYDALSVNPDGRAYVIVRLEDPVVREEVTFDECLQRVHERQQEVLDAFSAGEFELTHRPPRAAGLSGRVSDAGLTRLAAHSLVRPVHLNPMRPLPVIESPAPSAATASTLQNLTAQAAGGTAMGAGCLGLMRSLSAIVSPLPAQTENLT